MTFKKYQFLKPLNVLVLCLCITSSGFSQSPEAPVPDRTPARKDLSMERALLFSQLQALEKETLEFNNPLAEALAKAEIAEAAWELDLSWAKKVLRAAYKLVLPTAEQNQGQNSPAGSVPLMLDAAGRARRKIRLRVLEVARRDKDFVNELIELEGENLGAYGKHFASAALADQAIEAGDVNASADYILQGIKADPTQGTAPDIINRVAMRDRTLADRLILQYISELRGFPINSGNQSDVRAFFILSGLIRPRLIIDPSIKIQPPGSEVMRAYISYMLEALNMLEQKEPGYLQRRRRLLLS
ncbi:MAG: hypothetical protein H0T60_17505, partial [Acidobacteria bacterium]|nr:hypothetical protein [Acidobacteriota bacterium]